MVHITLSNSKKIIYNSNIRGLDLVGQLYKIPIFFFSKYETNALLAIQELLKDPQNYFKDVYVPFKPTDTFSLVYEGKHPAYHKTAGCTRLTSRYTNFEIPSEIKDKGKEKVEEYRNWFHTVKDLIDTPDVFAMRLQLKWGITTNPKAISIENGGIMGVNDLSIEDLEKNIEQKIREAGLFYNSSAKNKSILNELYQINDDTDKSTPIKNSNTDFTYSEMEALKKEFATDFKEPLKKMLIEYYRLKHNPEIKMEGKILEQIGFKPCELCYGAQRATLEDFSFLN